MDFYYLLERNQQSTWAAEAVKACRAPLRVPTDTAVVLMNADEPPCPGHQDYMCTQMSDDLRTATLTIRRGADDPSQPYNAGVTGPGQLKRFFMESVVHEVGHVISFYRLGIAPDADVWKAGVAAMFQYQGATGAGAQAGTASDWNPIDKPWEDRIQEAVAEVFKDAFLPHEQRVYDNRTNWKIDETNFALLISLLLHEPGGTDERDWYVRDLHLEPDLMVPFRPQTAIVLGAIGSGLEPGPGSDHDPPQPAHIVTGSVADPPPSGPWYEWPPNFDHTGYVPDSEHSITGGIYWIDSGTYRPSGSDDIPPEYWEGYNLYDQSPVNVIGDVVPESMRALLKAEDIHLYLEVRAEDFGMVTKHWLSDNFGVPDFGGLGDLDTASAAEATWRVAIDLLDPFGGVLMTQEYHLTDITAEAAQSVPLPPAGPLPGQLARLPNGSYGLELDWAALAGGYVRVRSVWEGASSLEPIAGFYGNEPPTTFIKWNWAWPLIDPHPAYPYLGPSLAAAQGDHAVLRLSSQAERARQYRR